MKLIPCNVKRIFAILDRDVNKIPWMILLFILLSIFDIVGIGLIAPYIMLITNPDLFMQSDIGSYLVTFGYSYEGGELLFTIGVILVVIFLIKTVISIFVNRVILKFCYNQNYKLRSLLMKIYQNMSYSEYAARNSSEYVHNIQVVVEKFSIGILQSLFRVFSEGIVVIVILLFLLWSNAQIVMLLSILFGVAILFYDYLFGKKMKSYGEVSNKHSSNMVKAIHEGIEDFKEIRVLGKEYYFYNKVRSEARRVSEANFKSTHISLIPRYLLEFMLIVFVVLLVNGSILFDQNIEYLIPTLGMFGVATIRIAPSINKIISGLSVIRFGQNFVDLLYKDIEKNLEFGLSGTSRFHKLKKKNLDEFCLLEVKNLYFAHHNSNKNVISDISITVNTGESIGLIGSSGSGKTTLVDLILGFFTPKKGEILVNGVSINQDISSWRSRIAYIPQKILIIDDTLQKNITFSEQDEVDGVKLEKAIKQARLGEVVDELANGLKTVVGENGARLSGGQCQRVAIARAFYHHKDIIVMDEATSALDTETEREVVNEIRQLKGRKTLIIIAHRLTTVQHCNQIYRLEDGMVLDSGPPEKIL